MQALAINEVCHVEIIRAIDLALHQSGTTSCIRLGCDRQVPVAKRILAKSWSPCPTNLVPRDNAQRRMKERNWWHHPLSLEEDSQTRIACVVSSRHPSPIWPVRFGDRWRSRRLQNRRIAVPSAQCAIP